MQLQVSQCNILTSSKRHKLFNSLKFSVLPKKPFRSELRRVGEELWIHVDSNDVVHDVVAFGNTVASKFSRFQWSVGNTGRYW